MRALVDAVPPKGAAKYDFLRQLLRGLVDADAAAPKQDLVWDLLHAYQRKAAQVADAAGARLFWLCCVPGPHALLYDACGSAGSLTVGHKAVVGHAFCGGGNCADALSCSAALPRRGQELSRDSTLRSHEKQAIGPVSCPGESVDVNNVHVRHSPAGSALGAPNPDSPAPALKLCCGLRALQMGPSRSRALTPYTSSSPALLRPRTGACLRRVLWLVRSPHLGTPFTLVSVFSGSSLPALRCDPNVSQHIAHAS